MSLLQITTFSDLIYIFYFHFSLPTCKVVTFETHKVKTFLEIFCTLDLEQESINEFSKEIDKRLFYYSIQW